MSKERKIAKTPATGGGVFQKVYAIVATIPAGTVVTYGQIAKRIGGGVTGRTVGFAMRAAPAERDLPCHRVVNRKGEMSPGYVFGSAAVQRKRLADEGVTFLEDGRINLTRSQWDFTSAHTTSRSRKKGNG
ncbi:MAG: methylated-DNA--[protein]-cysteine S-methyltransferase [Planctomycetaceae bacterium]|nr:methylated-DNA--[protein]-cysteine S-methyltransferase [Planctomycetaceae bacterium]